MTAEHDSRPKPQYGEYADPAAAASTPAAGQGAEQSATGAADTATPRDPAGRDSAHTETNHPAGAAQPPAGSPLGAAPAHATPPPTAQQPTVASGRLPGVPHNLGVSGKNQNGQPAGSTTPVQTPGQPQRAHTHAAPANHPAPNNTPYGPTDSGSAAAPALTAAAPQRPRNVDRVITIVLLAVGAYFTLSMALTLSQFSLEFSRIAQELGVTTFVPSPTLKVLGTVGAIVVLALYALVLIFSIRRLRARKLTFWAPLAAGAIAWALFFVLFFVGLNQSPELWQALMKIASDPEAAKAFMDRVARTS